ncbi:hypothetical protein M409DRAFT_50045 [Zasmidium cellare ATCC 36951]|uniref:BD-FAE-like domain-containing protein n=1 Tax=Zasmidium cellare ATCC 36951 TaxID=1080233 RepID=A0A6A6D3U8_ZASCE|nr:uncharacterized protein M409DRAFT_50045 [Zasmidium cellare ATCC 36951]KAF2172326.1 hypothetical protein M409DRAFT_50045 [Zasmidium cellare ATCC 36951]
MAEIKPAKADIVYKTVGKLNIAFDLFLPDNNAKNLPILLWYHGGGLLQGHKGQLAPHMRKAPNKYGLAVISADYRLAPQASVQEILEDVQDGIKFIRTQLASQVGEGVLDVNRLAVSGSSAGGYLSLLAGIYVEPKPNVILPIYPITDPLGYFFTNPQPPPMGRKLVEREDIAEFLDPKADQVASNAQDSPRMNMYVRMLHDANLAKLWHVPEGEAVDKFRLSRQIYGRRSSPAYFLHGDADSCVGVEQADEVVGAMLGCGIEVVYERPHDKDHFLDTPPDYENEAFYSFLLKHV